jgi:biotin transport system substrate-specific component
MTSYAYADIFCPLSKKSALVYNVLLVLTGSAAIALAAQAAVNLPFSPVPITSQTLAVLLAGAVLGSRRGLLSAIAYIGYGVMGLPVFAGGAAGIAHLIGPTGGYLLGFVLAAYITGFLSEKGWGRYFVSTFLAMLLGNIALYIFGLGWLAIYIGADNVLTMGLYPFIPGDLLKLLIATLALPSAWKIFGMDKKLKEDY